MRNVAYAKIKEGPTITLLQLRPTLFPNVKRSKQFDVGHQVELEAAGGAVSANPSASTWHIGFGSRRERLIWIFGHGDHDESDDDGGDGARRAAVPVHGRAGDVQQQGTREDARREGLARAPGGFCHWIARRSFRAS